jgi:hypothetical protein
MMPVTCGALKPPPCGDDRGRVGEALLVLFGVGLLAVAGIALPLVPSQAVVMTGAVGIAGGLLLGVPAGFWYHVRLYACLRARGPVPEGWWLRPVALHARLAPEERAGVLLWFYAGGLGFLVTVLGCALVVGGVILEGFRAGVF